MPVLQEWGLGVVLEALAKPPYEPFWEASLKHLSYKTVVFLAMAMAGSRSKLQSLEFDSKYL